MNLSIDFPQAVLADVFIPFQLAGNILVGSAVSAMAFLFLYHRNHRLLKSNGIVLYLAGFALLCGFSFLLQACISWFPMNWIPAFFLWSAGLAGWTTVVYIIRFFPELQSEKSVDNLEAEIAFRKNEEEKFRNLLEALPDASFIMNESGDMIMGNHQLEQMFGWKRAELIGKKMEVLVPEYAHPRQGKHRIDYLEHQRDKQFGNRENLSGLKKDGTIFPVEISISSVSHADGMWLLATIHNIPIRKTGEESPGQMNQEREPGAEERTASILEREKDHHYMFENSPLAMLVLEQANDAIILMDSQFRFYKVNQAGLALTHYSKEEFTQLGVRDVFFEGDIEKDPLQIDQQLINISVFKPGKIRRKDGSFFDADVSIKMLENGDFMILAKVIAERNEAEKKLVRSERLYRSLFDNMLNGFAFCKAILENDKLVDFTFLTVNEEYQKVIGLGNLSGKNGSQILPDLLKSNPELANRMLDAALYGKTSKFEQLVPQLNKWLSISLYGPETGYFVSLVDNITERKKAEAEIKALNEGLELRVKERTEELESFSYSVSHDLRAPLRAVKGYAKILEEDYAPSFDQEGRRLLGEVQSHAQNMGFLIDELLAFSRLGRKDVNKDRINMEMMIRDIIKEISITTEIKADIQFGELLPVMADRFLLKHVMMNLLSNSLKFSSHEAHPLVRICSSKQNGVTTYSIQDNGVGFEMNYRHKLFNLFQRLHTMEEFPGTGVGLSIVQRIIHKHNGKVWGVGKINEGATFFFSLPDSER